MACIRGDGLDRALGSVEPEVVGAFGLPPEALLDLLGEPVRLGAEPLGRPVVVESRFEHVGPGSLCRDDVALVLAKGDRQWRLHPLGVEHGVLGVLPALVVIPAARACGVLLQPVTVRVAVPVDPFEGALDIRAHQHELRQVAVPAKGLGGGEDEQGRRVVGSVVGSVRDEVQLGELAVADLVLDLAGLKVVLVVGDRALEIPQGPQGGEGEPGDNMRVCSETMSESRPNNVTNQGTPAAGTHPSRSSTGAYRLTSFMRPIRSEDRSSTERETVAASIGSEVLMPRDVRDPVAGVRPVRVSAVDQRVAGRRRPAAIGQPGQPLEARVPVTAGRQLETEHQRTVGEFGRRVRTFHGELERPDESLVPVRGDE